MAFIVCLVGVVASYGWLADTVKYGGFIALGAFAITARLLKFAFSNVDPSDVFSLGSESSTQHNSDINQLDNFDCPNDPIKRNIPGTLAWMIHNSDD